MLHRIPPFSRTFHLYPPHSEAFYHGFPVFPTFSSSFTSFITSHNSIQPATIWPYFLALFWHVLLHSTTVHHTSLDSKTLQRILPYCFCSLQFPTLSTTSYHFPYIHSLFVNFFFLYCIYLHTYIVKLDKTIRNHTSSISFVSNKCSSKHGFRFHILNTTSAYCFSQN